MIIVVLMAGNSIRFREKGFTVPKPFIELKKGLTILDYTLDSFDTALCPIYFTIRSDWDYWPENELKTKYPRAKFVYFNKLTRGNLETAFLALAQIDCKGDSDIMFLDCDNHYDESGLPESLHRHSGDFGHVCCFRPIDDSAKWGFAIPSGNQIIKFMEKDPAAFLLGGLPMIGNFYFSSIKLFKLIAEKTLYHGAKVKNEFFMTQAMQKLIDYDIPVYYHVSPKMIPLGTPEDYEAAKKGLNENLP